jgi:aldehyde dehydrogenase (NAD+)
LLHGITLSIGFLPLVSAVAGNQVVLKPSELTGNTAAIENNNKTFHVNHVEVIQGGCVQNLLAQRWDYIFFTGSVSVGK